jgi:hypothetical protein
MTTIVTARQINAISRGLAIITRLHQYVAWVGVPVVLALAFGRGAAVVAGAAHLD